MTVRVIIEREVEPGQEARLQNLMTQSRSKATKVKGYISGETLRALDHPNKFVVLSTWNSAADWRAGKRTPNEPSSSRNWLLYSWAGKNAPYIRIFDFTFPCSFH